MRGLRLIHGHRTRRGYGTCRNQSPGIEGFGAFSKPSLYTDRGVATDHFPMDRKERACRFDHRGDKLLTLFLYKDFGFVRPMYLEL